MALNLNLAGESKPGIGHVACGIYRELDKQRLRILRCTAQAMASSPGGLRFKSGTRPWLDGIEVARTNPGQTRDANLQSIAKR